MEHTIDGLCCLSEKVVDIICFYQGTGIGSMGIVVNTKDHLNTFAASSLDGKDERNVELNLPIKLKKAQGLTLIEVKLPM